MTIGASPTQCGNAPSAASSSSWTLTTTADLDAGEVGVLRLAFDNISATDGDNDEVASVTGGTGTWEKLAEYTNSQGAGAAGVTVATWLFTPSANNATGTVFTITLQSNRTQKVAALEKWTVGSGSSLRQTVGAAVVTSQVDAGGGFGSATYSGLSSTERLYLRVLGAEMSTTASVSATSGYTALSTFRSSTSSPISLLGEFRVNTSTDETSNPAFTPTADKAGLFFALEEYSTGGGGSVSASASATLDDLTASAQAALAITGELTASLGAVTSSSSAALRIGGQGNIALAPVLVASITTLPINASIAASLNPLTSSASSTLTILGTAAATLGQLIVSANAGTEALPAIVGGADITFGSLTLSASAQLTALPANNASGSGNLGSITLSSSAKLAIASSASTTLGPAVLAATSSLIVTGIGSAALDAVSLAGLSVVAIRGQGSVALDTLVVSGNGSAEALPSITGGADVNLGGLSFAGSGQLALKSSASLTLGAISLSAAARVSDFSLAGPVRFLKFHAPEKALQFVAQIKRLTFIAGSGEMQIMPTKYSEEIWLCSLNLAAWIGEGNSVANFNVELISGSAIVDQADLLDPTTGKWRVTGGEVNSTTVFRAFATMLDGQVYAQEFRLFVA